MKFRLLAPAAVLALAGLCAAGDAQTYDLSQTLKLQAGDASTTTVKGTEKRHQTISGADGTVLQDTTTEKATTARFVEKVVAVDDKGRATKTRVHLAEWAIQEGEAKDQSIEGAVLEVVGLAKDRKWSFVSEGVEPSDEAREWLDKEWGSGTDEEAAQAAMAPKKPVAVGDTWTPDVAALLASGLGDKLTADAAKSTCTAKLESVEGDAAKIAITLELAVTQIQTPMGAMELKKGAMKLTGHDVQAIKGRPVEAVSGHEMVFDAEVSKEDQGQTFTIHIEVTTGEEKTVKLGGEIPEPQPK